MPNTVPKPSLTEAIHVAVGVIRSGDGRILIALRPDTAHQGGLWEFPGGKVEAGETVEQALQRELFEELAINAEAFTPLMVIEHDYGDKSVTLDVYWVERFSGEACGSEGQEVRWVAVNELENYNFPKANKAILAAVMAA